MNSPYPIYGHKQLSLTTFWIMYLKNGKPSNLKWNELSFGLYWFHWPRNMQTQLLRIVGNNVQLLNFKGLINLNKLILLLIGLVRSLLNHSYHVSYKFYLNLYIFYFIAHGHQNIIIQRQQPAQRRQAPQPRVIVP